MSENTITYEINGIPVVAEKGSMIIEAADEAGIKVPRFCYHKNLSVAANCRMCMIEVEGGRKPMPACATPAADGMKVFTKSPGAIAAQKGTMEFLLINHPLDCPVCDQGGECELQDVAMGYGGDVSQYSESKRVVADKDIGPLVATDMTRCIHCTRCVRFGEEIAGMRELGATGRGEHVEIGTYVAKSMKSELSGNVIDLCPVGALTAKPSRYTSRPWELVQRPAIAPHDAIGSNLFVHIRNDKVMRVVPRENEAVNETWISDRDRFSYEGLYSDDRAISPMVKKEGEWKTTNWETALDAAISGLKQHNPELVGGLMSDRATLEELYLGQKLLRSMGVHNIDSRLLKTDFCAQKAMPLFPWLGTNIASIETQKNILLIGADLRNEQPLLSHRVRKASLAGASIMAINCSDYDYTFDLSQQVIAHPAAMINALAAVVAVVAKQKSCDIPDVIASLVNDAPADAVTTAMAQALIDEKESIVLLGQNINNSPYASTAYSLATVLQAAGIAIGFVSEASNTAGAHLAGVLPHRGPAGEALDNIGLHASSMWSQPREAYFLWGIEPEYDTNDPKQALAALHKADLVVVATAFVTDTMKEYADVILPLATFVETSGTYVNADGRWQSVAGCVKPVGDARPGWKVLRVLGELGDFSGFEHVSSEEVRDELKQKFAQGFEFKNTIGAIDKINLPTETSDATVRLAGANLYRSDALVRRSESLQKTPAVQDKAIVLHPAYAQKLGVADKEVVDVTQSNESIQLRLRLDSGVPEGCAMLATGSAEVATLGSQHGHIDIK